MIVHLAFLAALLAGQVQAPGHPGRPVLPMRAIERYAKMHQVDPRFIRGILWIESYGDARAVGASGERGYMQIMEGTARYISNVTGLDYDLILNDPDTNIRAGTWLFALWYHRFEDLDMALAAYNKGAGVVIECDCVPPSAEHYISKARSTLTWGPDWGWGERTAWPSEICLDGGHACLSENASQ